MRIVHCLKCCYVLNVHKVAKFDFFIYGIILIGRYSWQFLYLEFFRWYHLSTFSLTMSLLRELISLSYWYSLILFIIIMGRILVLEIYVTRVSPNEMTESSWIHWEQTTNQRTINYTQECVHNHFYCIFWNFWCYFVNCISWSTQIWFFKSTISIGKTSSLFLRQVFFCMYYNALLFGKTFDRSILSTKNSWSIWIRSYKLKIITVPRTPHFLHK